MATATQQRPSQQQLQPASELDSLFQQVLENTPRNQKIKATIDQLMSRVKLLEELLPPTMKGQAERLIKRAQLTLSRRQELDEVDPTSFMRCVLEAAELGLAIDGKLAHAVVYNNKVKDPKTGRDVWRKEAQLQVDYKGLISVARRTGLIKSISADVIKAGDTFRAYRDDDKPHIFHERKLGDNHGDVLGAFAIVTLPDGTWDFCVMDIAELNRIQAKSKAKSFGPWTTDIDEMRKKTVIRRLMKLFQEDPGIQKVLEIEDRDYEVDEPPPPAPPTRGRHQIAAPRYEPEPENLPPAGQQHEEDLPQQSQPSAQDHEHADFCNDLFAKIAASATPAELASIGVEIDENAAYLGAEAHNQAMVAFKARQGQLTSNGKPRRTADAM